MPCRAMSRRIVLVEYFFTANRLLAFVVRPDLAKPEVVTVATDVTHLQQDIRDAADDPKTKLREVLGRPSLAACIKPLIDHTDPDDLVCIVPSRELFYLPLHAVAAEGAPLIVRNPIFYAPSASVLRYCVRRRQPPEAPRRGATVFGNPNWDLRHAEEEAAAVADALGTRAIIGVDVTRPRWDEALATSDIIHFAGHAEFNARDPLASRLLLASRQTVSARELFSSRVNPLRLVTLSGCQTGMNRVHPGDELLGLTRALLYAGASSLLLTLWRIDDAISSELMKSFYARWLRHGELKADALRGAQQDVLANGETDPYLWAPFVLIGDWS